MKKLTFLIPFIAAFSFNAIAQEDVQVEDFTMDVAKHKKHGKHHAKDATRRLVTEYMLENGDITEAEIEAMKEERKAVREELRALREAGDKEALKARISELREARRAEREELKEYIAGNTELAEAIRERRQEIRERKKERREEIRERREERREQTEGS